MMPVGRLTGRVEIGEHRFMGRVVVLAVNARDVILKIDFLARNCAIIDIHKGMISLWSGFPHTVEPVRSISC